MANRKWSKLTAQERMDARLAEVASVEIREFSRIHDKDSHDSFTMKG
jgi:hypothetical protein